MKSRRKKNKNPTKSRVIKKTGLQTEERYLSILKELPDIVYKIDQDGHFTFINDAIGILGYKPKDLIGKHFSKLVHPDDVKLFSRHFVLPHYKGKITGHEKAPKLFDERRTGKRKTDDLEIRLIRKKSRNKEPGSIIGAVIAFGDVSSAGYYDGCVIKSEKEFLGTLGIIRNITKTKQAEKKLHYQADLLQNVSDAIISTDMDFKIRTWNKAAEEMYGWKAHEVIDKRVHRITRLKYPYDRMDDVVKKFHKHGYWKGEVIQKHRNGTIINVLSSLSLIKDPAGKPFGAIAVNRDITKLKGAGEKLKQSEEKYRNIVESAPDGIVTVNKKGIVTSVNTSFCQRIDFSKEDIIGKHISKIPSARLEDIPKHIKIFSALLRGKIPKSFELRWVHKDKSIHWGEVHVSVMEKNGKTIGFQAIIRDVTERKKAEEAFKKSSQEWQTTFDSTSDLIVLQDANHNIIRANQATAKFLGLPMEKIIGQKCYRLFHGDEFPPDICPFRKAKKNKKREDAELHLSEKNLWIQGSVDPILDAKGNLSSAIHIIRDITEHKQTEEVLRENEERYRTLVEQLPSITYTAALDETSTTLYVSPQIEKILGIAPEKYKANPDFWLEQLHDEDRERVLKEMNHARENDQPFISEYRMVSTDGRIVWLRDEAVTIKDDEGTPQYLQGVMLDITERKKAEQALRTEQQRTRELTNRIITTQEKERLYLASEIHDDLLQGLVAVLYFLQMIDISSLDQKTKNQKKELIKIIKSSIERCRGLISEIEPLREPKMGLIQAIKKSIDQKFINTDTKAHLDYPRKIPQINLLTKTNVLRIIQEALMNVQKHADATEVSIKLTASKGKLRIKVKDNGIGFDPKSISSKMIRHYGLLTMQERAHLIGGELTLSSHRGKGTIIIGIFPLE